MASPQRRGRSQGGALWPSLLLATLLIATSATSAAAACDEAGDASSSSASRFWASFASSSQALSTRTTRSKASVTTTSNTYCFTVAADAAATAACSTGSACCNPASRLAKITVAVEPSCVADAAGKKRVRLASWKLGTTTLSSRLAADNTVQLTVPRSVTWGTPRQLCVTLKDETPGTNASTAACSTLQGVCGGTGSCSVTMSMTGPKSTCCNAVSQIPLTTLTPCEAGQGGPQCSLCAPGTFAPGGTNSLPRPSCAPCPAGRTTSSTGATSAGACTVSMCPAGHAGANCTATAFGFFSAGGSVADPNPSPKACPAGWTTSKMTSTSQDDCTVPVCKPGQGGTGCKSCPYGTFSTGGTPYYPNPDCVRCPNGGFTVSLGSRSQSDCQRPFSSRCLPGYAVGDDGACHRCPYDTWSSGGTLSKCTLCPGRAITMSTGSTSESSCVIPSSFADGSFSWTAAKNELLNQQCRKDLIELFGSSADGGARWEPIVTGKLSGYESCRVTDHGLREAEVLWRSRLLAAAQLPDFLSPDNAASLPPNWSLLGVGSYGALWGTISASGIGDWTPVSRLETLYEAARATFVPGPIFAAIKLLSVSERDDVVSMLQDALNKRQSEAFTYFEAKMNKDRAIGWLLIRAMRAAAQEFVPGLPSENTPLKSSMVKMVKVLGPGLRTTSSGDGLGIRELPVFDPVGNYRFIVCGSGVMENGARAGMMAITPFGDTSYCMKTANQSGAGIDTKLDFWKISDDSDLAESIGASLEVKASPFGVNVGAGAQFTLEKTASVDSVFITAMGSKLENAPLTLPSTFAPMTPEALSYLRNNGRKQFASVYGTHFVYGFRLGSFISFTLQYQSNEQLTKLEIAGQLNAENGTTSAQASAEYKRALTAKGVNIRSSVRTNSELPSICADLAISENFDPDKTKACVTAWNDLPPQAAYYALAVPFEFHPNFTQNLPEWDIVPLTNTDDISNLDRNKAAGLLRVRLNQIKASLSTYPLKEDAFYAKVQRTIEEATSDVNSLLDKLREGLITSFDQYNSMFKAAFGKVNKAALQADFVPSGSKCGWCTSVTYENRQGKCSSDCSGTLQCTLDCPGQDLQPCRFKGFVYNTYTDPETAALSPQCKTAVTGPQCLEFGHFGDSNGAFYCRQTVCDWVTEYCDGEVKPDVDGLWGCLGTCKPRANTYYSRGPACDCLNREEFSFPDGDKCVWGAKIYPQVYWQADGTRRQYWPSIEELQRNVSEATGDAFVEVPFNNDDGVKLASVKFLTTNCPPLAPVAIWNTTDVAPGTPFPGTSDPRVKLFTPLACICSGIDGWWIDLPE